MTAQPSGEAFHDYVHKPTALRRDGIKMTPSPSSSATC